MSARPFWCYGNIKPVYIVNFIKKTDVYIMDNCITEEEPFLNVRFFMCRGVSFYFDSFYNIIASSVDSCLKMVYSTILIWKLV